MARRRAWKQNGCRWQVAPDWDGAAENARLLKTSPLIAQILHNRGLDEIEHIRRFLNPKMTDLHRPELLGGMDVASERLASAVRDGEKICIYGDYDVDGITAVAILYRCLALHGADVDFYVPHRLEEGYGVNVEAIEKIAADGVKLLVTVDCGISAVEQLRRAGELGMDAIVTDHHAPDPSLPEVLAVVHPALAGNYPNADLSGAGVAFKLAWHLARRLCGSERVDEPTRNFLLEATTLAALGTIADVVPLLDENRVLVVYGLKGLAATEHPGLRALITSACLDCERLDTFDIGFRLAPRLNACGRMGHARLAVEMLTRATPDRCRRIAEYLEKQNTERQKIERRITELAVEMVRSGAFKGKAIVLASSDWHAGVVGIVASRLVDRFGKPAVLIALEGATGRGSARSVEGFNMRDALSACSEHLLSFGGHAMAGGLRLSAEAVGKFTADFVRYAGENIAEDAILPALRIDAEVMLAELPFAVVERLERLGPFGRGNPRPLVAVRSVRIMTPPQRIGRNGGTVSFIVGQEQPQSTRMRCVGFGMGKLADKLAGVNTVDIVGEPVLNHFNGRSSVEMHLRDVVWE
ncbi:MAG: single-stranded-DNA-specific exonuclease RecJ [Planctomycetota bacterium]|nr:single-stranded-DNA-specific exonuclease RecJ [Planctomycetota bacterium]